jgi:hypothetical protein
MIRIRRFAFCLVAVLAAAAASAVAAPAAFATIAPPGPADATTSHSPASTVHTVVDGGMPGWQIALIAAAAAVLAAALAVLADRMFRARRTGAAGLGRRAARLGSGTAA